MNKELQRKRNEAVEAFYNAHKYDLDRYASLYFMQGNCERLNNCNAWVCMVDNLLVLRSYHTIVAVIDEDGTLYDFLRYVYGYTATSAKQISKFADKYHATNRLTWREV